MAESKNFKIESDEEGYVNIKLKSVFVESMWIEQDRIDEFIDVLNEFKKSQ